MVSFCFNAELSVPCLTSRPVECVCWIYVQIIFEEVFKGRHVITLIVMMVGGWQSWNIPISISKCIGYGNS